MNRNGFVLLTVLWLAVGLGALGMAALAVARQGGLLVQNRVRLRQGYWAREGCLAIVRGRYREGEPEKLDSVPLGAGVWCSVSVVDLGTRLNVNEASEAALRAFFRNDTLVDSFLDWLDADSTRRPLGAEAAWYRDRRRPLPRNGAIASPDELTLVRGFEDGVSGLSLIGVKRHARINLQSAPREVLRTVAGMTEEGLEVLLRQRDLGLAFRSLDEYLGRLSPAARQALADNYADLSARVAVAPEAYEMTVQGKVAGSGTIAQAIIVVVPVGNRLAIVHEESS